MPYDSPDALRAQRIAAALGHVLGTGPLRVRVFPKAIDGDVPWSTVELAVGGRFRVVGAVFGLGKHTTVAHIGTRGTRTALIGHAAHGAPAELVAEAIARWLRDGGLSKVGVTAFDAACDGLPLLAREVALAGYWRAGFWGQWDARGVSGASLEPAGDDAWPSLVTLTQEDTAVSVAVGAGALSPAVTRAASSLDELAEVLAWLPAQVRRCLEARRAHYARPFSLSLAGQRILSALRTAGVANKGWKLSARDRFPFGHADGVIERTDHLGPHFEVLLNESADGVNVSAGALCETFAHGDALEAALERIVDATRAQRATLTPDKLEPGATYRALQPFSGLQPGDRVRFLRPEHFPRDGGTAYHFTRVGANASVSLFDVSDVDCELLRALHVHLAREGAV